MIKLVAFFERIGYEFKKLPEKVKLIYTGDVILSFKKSRLMGWREHKRHFIEDKKK